MPSPFFCQLRLKGKEEFTMMTEQYYRVWNRCKHMIGVQLLNGRTLMIRPGSFQLLSAADIQYIESICRTVRYFSSKMLVPTDERGNEIDLNELGVATYEGDAVHLNDDEITAMLKKSAKQIEAWINNIEDPAELHAIFMRVKELDLPATKLKVLSAKMPTKDFLGE